MKKHKSKSTLNEKVAALYEPVEGLPNSFASAEFGVVDLSKVTLEFAAQLEEKGYLKKLGSLME